MNASCQYHRFLATTYHPDSPGDSSYPAARLIEWCEHPNSIYPKDKKLEKLPCGGDLEKCTLLSGGKKAA